MAPKKKEPNHHQLLRTPENPKRTRSRREPQTYEQSYKQHLSFQSHTNKNGNYNWNHYLDLMEDGEPKDDFNLAEIDVDQFQKFRTSQNEGAIVVSSLCQQICRRDACATCTSWIL
jgi:hypothetical protein